MTVQIDAASRPRLITLDRLIALIIAIALLGVQGAWTVFLAWAALGAVATMVGPPNIEVPATVKAGSDKPLTAISAPAEKALAAEAHQVPLATAAIFSPRLVHPSPAPNAADRAVKRSADIEHAPVRVTRRTRSVGPKKYVRQRHRPSYAKLRQQYIAPHQHYLPPRGWGGGQFGPSPYSEAGQ
jgi:hypothetical protein